MSDRKSAGQGGTRYGHTSTGGGSQDQGERKDEGWQSRQGGRQSQEQGRQSGRDDVGQGTDRGGKPGGTNTQGDLAGIGGASRAEADAIRRSGEHESPEATDARRLEAERRADPRVSEGTPEHPRHARMAEGAQNADTRGTGAGGFDRGVDASQVGAPYQGAKPEDPSRATEPGDPGT